MSTWNPAPGGAIELSVPSQPRQRRPSVAFRFLLLVPQVAFGFFFAIAAEAIGFIGWFGALFTGRLPEWAADFLAGYVRWYARVLAYAWFLTDRYPPFKTGDDPGYPIQVAITPGRLNRWSVLFRVVLIVPATVASTLVVYGLQVFGVVIWLIVLIKGRMPENLRLAVAAVVRYLVRYNGFLLMLSSAYPSGLLGDGPPASAPPLQFPDAPAASPQGPRSDWWENLRGGPNGGPGLPAEANGRLLGALAQPSDPSRWRLTLGPWARVLVGAFVFLGAAGFAGNMTLGALSAQSAFARTSADLAVDQLNGYYLTLGTQTQQFAAAEAACDGSATPLRCVQSPEVVLSRELDNFAQSVFTLSVPASAYGGQELQSATAERGSSELLTLSREPSPAAYAGSQALQDFKQDAPLVDAQYRLLVSAIRAGA